MPYWSSSRVGAVPMGGTASNKKQRSKRRGITMEDLKKQTAMRLAQEQGRTEEPTLTPPKFTPPGDCSEMGANPKLPHGLTVQELKEMTKARLQAEAGADFRDPAAPPPIRGGPSVVIPVPVQSNSGHSNPSTGSGGPPPPATSLMRPTIPPGPPSVPPPGYQPSHFEMPHPSHPPIDTLDNASVSTAASDYPDSVYSLNGSREEAIPFARSASYPNHYSSGENSLPETPSYYSNPMLMTTPSNSTNEPPNRRRAATLSPRPAAYADWRRHVAPPTRTRSAVQQPDPNRARTNSAVSLPAFSTTDEEFRIRSRIRSVREDSPWVSDVFRNGSGGSLQSRPSSEVLATASSSAGCLQDQRMMWGEPFFACGQDISDDLASILKLSGAEEK